MRMMTQRELLHEIMAFRPTDRLPNYELGVWPQAVERWRAEGMPNDIPSQHWFVGESTSTSIIASSRASTPA